jgi:hypothetical protein
MIPVVPATQKMRGNSQVIEQDNSGGNQMLPKGAISQVSSRGSKHGFFELDECTDLP